MQSVSLFFNFSPKKDNSSSSSQFSIDICTLPNWFMKRTLFDSFQKHAVVAQKTFHMHANLNVGFLSPNEGKKSPTIGYKTIKSCLFTLPNGFNDFELSIQYIRQSLRKNIHLHVNLNFGIQV